MKRKSAMPLRPDRSWKTEPVRNISPLTFYLCLILFCITGIQCKKSAPTPNILPPITREGLNTFGCLVNGQPWSPYATCNIFFGQPCKELAFKVYQLDSMHKFPIEFYLEAGRTSGTMAYSSFMIHAPYPPSVVKTGNIIDSLQIIYDKDTSSFFHFPGDLNSGSFNITKLDTANMIVAGTFSFILRNSGGDSVVITEGRFDVKFNACLCHIAD